MSWTVPLSSSPPSTPGSKDRTNHANGFGSFATNPSTTPAGPPPSSTNSFTPAGPPPSSVFGSSETDFRQFPSEQIPKFFLEPSSRRDPNSPSFKTVHPNKHRQDRELQSDQPLLLAHNFPGLGTRKSFSRSSPSPDPGSDYDRSPGSQSSGEQEDEDHEEGDYSEGSEQEQEFLNSHSLDQLRGPAPTKHSSMKDSVMSGDDLEFTLYGSSVNDVTPRGIKRPRGGAAVSHGSSSSHREDRYRTKKVSAIPSMAKNMALKLRAASLDDPDTLIVGTEEIVSRLYVPEVISHGQERALEIALPDISGRLCSFWKDCYKEVLDDALDEDFTPAIGPDEKALHFLRAIFIATLLLQLQHPPAARGKQAFAIPRMASNSTFSTSIQTSHLSQKPVPFPKILLDWLDSYHHPYKKNNFNLKAYHPNPTANFDYWDIMFSCAVRGQILEVTKILKKSDFRNAHTARQDGQGEDGYRGIQLGNIERVINRAIQLLESCPALQDGDWNVSGGQWQIFRKRVEQGLTDLANFAEGRDRDLDPEDVDFEAPNFGIQNPTTELSQSTRRAESRVPWTIYQNLKALYGIILGGSTEIISLAQDWVEAVIGLTVWWDGDDDDDDMAVGSLAMTRRSLRRSQTQRSRLVDVNSQAAYSRRLAFAFASVTNDSNENAFQISPFNSAEVGLASIFEGNIEGVIGLLKGWSLPVASAVVEIATLGGWYGSSSGGASTHGFNESDLMVLSYGQEDQVSQRDGLLADYADALFGRKVFQQVRVKESREGWELAIGVLSRLDDSGNAKYRKVCELLRRIPLGSDARVDKILNICREFGIDREAHGIAEKYADSIAEDSDRYGTAIIYYARAHSTKKVKDVLNLLISLSLVQSIAFPPFSSLDQNLQALVFFPKDSLDQLADLDHEAAELLHLHLTGYATLRKFYDLRDEEVNLKEGQKCSLRPTPRNKAALTALLAVINSAADNIHGGLYDQDCASVVQVDGLLALLGEALHFVDKSQSILSLPQCFALLKAIEDLETVTPRIYAQCEECFHSTLAAAYGTRQAPSPHDMLRKTVSSMTSNSGFSLVGSSMLESEISMGGTGSGSEVIVKPSNDGEKESPGVKRGWDWRKDLILVLKTAVLITHTDIVSDFNNESVNRLKALSENHKFRFFEDRTFVDIGNTVQNQCHCGTLRASK
ncbi:hypothetical protein MMC07_005163 [Pseudocyphellaria aurata]|nr:hypothetical protein [Pseudocyphellaria aurata]